MYDFQDNFITIITAKSLEEAIQFASNVWQKITNMKNIDVITLDPERKVLAGRNDLKDNYEKVVKDQKSSNFQICFIFGLDKLINYFEEIEKLQEMIKKYENNNDCSFIIVDSADKIKEHNYDEWYRQNVLDNNIIWVGNGIEDQYLLDVNAPRREIINDCGCSFGYINKKDRTILVKLLEMKDKREEDDE